MVVGATSIFTRTCSSVILSTALAGIVCGPAAAQALHFLQSEPIPTESHGTVTLKLLQGDGAVFSDPLRAIVVSGDGRLLAASPVSYSLRIVCEGVDRQRACLAYDELNRTVFQPVESDWHDGGLIEQNGEPQSFPEDMTVDFGFALRSATLGEVIRFELVGIVASWTTTVIALAWWTSFWLLLRPVARLLLRRSEPRNIGMLVPLLLRTVAALLMIPVTAYAWLTAPYSGLYLAFVVLVGAGTAQLVTGRRKESAA